LIRRLGCLQLARRDFLGGEYFGYHPGIFALLAANAERSAVGTQRALTTNALIAKP
jgi:hypothetical protein